MEEVEELKTSETRYGFFKKTYGDNIQGSLSVISEEQSAYLAESFSAASSAQQPLSKWGVALEAASSIGRLSSAQNSA